MGSVYEEISRLETAKSDIETAIETCGVNVPDTELIDTYASYIRQIPSAVFSELNVDPVGGSDQFIQSIKQTNGLIEATVGGLVSTSNSGLVPKIGSAAAATITTPADEWVLTSTKGAQPTWRKLPANAFKNDDNNTTYTLSGTLDGNAYDVTLTPSSGTATGAKVPTMGAASSSAAGTAGLVPAPAKNKHTSFLRGDGTWVVPDNTTYSVMTGATASAAGKSGLVPQPAKGDQGKFLSGAGTWTALPSLSITDTESGNAVTDVEVSGHGITLKRGTTFSVNGHKHSSDDITALTSYVKATAASAIESTDSLNAALGKLELKADAAYTLTAGAYDGDGTIENLAEILKVLEGISDTDTIQAIVGKYLPLAGGMMTGNITFDTNRMLRWHQSDSYSISCPTGGDGAYLLLKAHNGTTIAKRLSIYKTATSLPNTAYNLYTDGSLYAASATIGGPVKITGGSDLTLQASSGAQGDAGDVVFMDYSGAELGRIWLDSTASQALSLRYGANDATKRILHSGNSSVSKSGETLTVKINGVEQSITNSTYTTLPNPYNISFKDASNNTVTYNGSSALDLTGGIYYAVTARDALRFKGLASSGDLNTVLAGGGMARTYSNYLTGDFTNAPSGAYYGTVLQLSTAGFVGLDILSGQLAWDINHNSTTDATRYLWWRAADTNGFTNSKWHQIAFTDSNVASATTSSYIAYTARQGKGSGVAQFAQYSGATDNPTDDWYSHIIMNHGNSTGYFTEIAACFHSDSVYFRRQVGTTTAWKRFAWTSDIPSALKNPNALTIFGISYDGSEAKTVNESTLINRLSSGTSDCTDDTIIPTSHANGWAGNPGVIYGRPASKLCNYINGKISSIYVPKNYNNIAYSDLTAYYTGSTSPGYYRIVLPNSVLSIWNLLTIELTVNQSYSNGCAGKILIYCHNNGSNTFPVFKASCLGTLTSDIKVYGSDGKYIYIGGCSAWGTISIDKILVGDGATSRDQSSISIDTTASLPTTYQTASMSYNIDSSNYTNYVNTTNFPGINKTGTVTKVSTGTGLTGGDITSTGIISISQYNPATYDSSGVAYVGSGVLEVGYILDFHSANSSDYNVRLRTKSGETGTYTVTLPSATGTLALTSQIPSVGNGTITINQAGASKGSFTLNQSTAATINLTDTNYYHTPSYSSGLSIASGTGVNTMYVPYATASQSGVVTTAAQTFAGAKTFTGAMTVNSTITFGQSDSYGIRTITDNYGRIGESSKRFYQCYVKNSYSTNGFWEDSDERLKNIIKPIKVDLDELSKLRKIYYIWKNPKDDQSLQLGMIAQDVQRIYPELVSVDKETGYLSLAYDRLSVLALEAIDVLYSDYKKLKERVDKLEKLLINRGIS